MISPAEELVQIVDRNNNPIGVEPRRVMRANGLTHRASYIFVFNSRDELFIQKRTSSKDIYPGYWDVAAGGVMLAGETDNDSARRELAEELGITVPNIEYLFHHYHETGNNKVWGAIYRCRHDGPFKLQAEEVEYGEFVSVDDVLRRTYSEDFTPDGIEILTRIIQLRQRSCSTK